MLSFTQSLFIKILIIFYFLLFCNFFSFADKISDMKCRDYEKTHPFNYQEATYGTKLAERFNYENNLLDKFPNSYIPYYNLGFTYNLLGRIPDNRRIEKKRKSFFSKAIFCYKKALKLCTDPEDKIYIKSGLANSKFEYKISEKERIFEDNYYHLIYTLRIKYENCRDGYYDNFFDFR
jgi:hypothetical protein